MKYLFRALTLIAFVGASFLALFLAFGYRFNPEHQNIEKTSIVDLTNQYKNSDIYLDNELKSREMPIQIRDVLPGYHFLSVKKEGFLYWSRGLKVHQDLVSKVEDVILFPADLESSTKDMIVFLEDSVFYFGKNSLAVSRPEQKFLTLILFKEDGILVQKELQLGRFDIENVEIFEPGYLRVSFLDHTYVWFDIEKNRTYSFPSNFEENDCRPEVGGGSFYCLADDILYQIPFLQLQNVQNINIDEFELQRNVDAFDLSQNKIYFISEGMLFSRDKKTSKLARIFGTLPGLKKIVFPPEQSEFIILGNAAQKSLYRLSDEKVVVLVPFLKSNLFFSLKDELLYTTLDGNIFFYEAPLSKNKFIYHFSDDLQLLDWFGDKGHFLFQQKGTVYLSDFYFSNVYPFKTGKPLDYIFVKGRDIFYLSEHRLRKISF